MTRPPKPKSSVSWPEPRWSYVPDMLRTLRGLARPASAAKLALISLLIVGPLCLLGRSAFPQIQLGPILWKFPLAILGLFVMFGITMALHVVFSPQVRVTRHGIRYIHGEDVQFAKRADLSYLKLVTYAPGMARLHVRLGGRRRKYGVGTPVDLEAIGRLLELPPRSIDMSHRFAMARATHEARRQRLRGDLSLAVR